MTDVFASNTAQLEKRDLLMTNGNESRDVHGDSRKRYRCPWAEIGKYRIDRVKNQSDCRIRYRALWKKINDNISYFAFFSAMNLVENSQIYGGIIDS